MAIDLLFIQSLRLLKILFTDIQPQLFIARCLKRIRGNSECAICLLTFEENQIDATFFKIENHILNLSDFLLLLVLDLSIHQLTAKTRLSRLAGTLARTCAELLRSRAARALLAAGALLAA